MYKIDASFMLIHLLKRQSDCTISDLVKKKNMIEEKIPSVFIDVSRVSVLSSVECFPDIFEFRDNKIAKRKDSERFFSEPVIEYFNFDVEKSIKMEIIKLLGDE